MSVAQEVVAGKLDTDIKYQQLFEVHMCTHVQEITHVWTWTYTYALFLKMCLCINGKQGHMHPDRNCYTHIEIKLASTISFLPKAAGPICKHQTASLQKTCWLSLFKTSPQPLNEHSCVYTERIFINCSKLNFNPWSRFHWRNLFDWSEIGTELQPCMGQKNKSERWCKLLFVVLFFLFFSVTLMKISRDTGILTMAQRSWNSTDSILSKLFLFFSFYFLIFDK